MEELKLLEKMLRQRDKGELPDYQGEGAEQEQWVELNAHGSMDGIAQTWLDEMRWQKTEELTQRIWEPEARSSFARLSQRCAMQVLLEREGENYLKRLLQQRREDDKQAEEWRREHGDAAPGAPGGLGVSAAAKKGEPREQEKDAARSVGGVKQAEVGQEQGQARARDRKAVRNEPVSHGEDSAWGHMETWIQDRATTVESDGRHRVKLGTLDLHNRIFIRGRHDPSWSCIEDFEEHYGQAHDTSFATYEGVLLHENQHVQERTAIYNKHLGAFRSAVAAIEAETAEEALEQYEELFADFEQKVDDEYFQVGEVPARALEWEYYHAAYEQETGERGVSRDAARAAGATQGRKETAAQSSQLGMMARASEHRGASHHSDPDQDEATAPQSAAPHAERLPGERPVLGAPSRLAAAPVDGPGLGGAWPAGDLESGPGRPRLLAHLGRPALPREASAGILHFLGARPVFALGGQTRVVGARAGVALHPSASLAGHELPAGTEVVPASGESPDGWLLRWWNAGAVEQAVSRAQERR